MFALDDREAIATEGMRQLKERLLHLRHSAEARRHARLVTDAFKRHALFFNHAAAGRFLRLRLGGVAPLGWLAGCLVVLGLYGRATVNDAGLSRQLRYARLVVPLDEVPAHEAIDEAANRLIAAGPLPALRCHDRQSHLVDAVLTEV